MSFEWNDIVVSEYNNCSISIHFCPEIIVGEKANYRNCTFSERRETIVWRVNELFRKKTHCFELLLEIVGKKINVNLPSFLMKSAH